ncbi:MAG: Asp-tRNA(Asn)/Glu-tRNA(Gln) amidotransferase subunit GatA [Acidobacteriota bacterium]
MSTGDTPLWQRSARDIAAAVRAGEVTAVAVFDACRARAEAVEPTIDAFLVLPSDADRTHAEAVDAKRARGETLGPLAGVPIAIKDNISLADAQLTCGSRILEGYVAPFTATAVARLLAADAVPFGRCNLDEFAMGSSCENSAFKPTRNPWRIDRVPGGSSGGPAAAVASGCVPLALGSDTGGSIRQPAAFCGVVGLKPTYGRISRYGLVAFASSTDQIGPLTRDVDDAALALAVMAGADPNDATCLTDPVDDGWTADLDASGDLAGLRLGVPTETDIDALDDDVRSAWRATLARLEAAGATIDAVALPALPLAVPMYYVIAPSEASANLSRFDGVRYGHRAASPDDLTALYHRSRSEGFGAEVKRRILLGAFALSSGHYDAYYGRAQAARAAMRAQFATAFRAVDALITPTAPTGAFGLGARVDDPVAMYLSDIYTTPASLVGGPGLSVPCGVDADGLPLGLQIMTRRRDERGALRIGRAALASADWTVTPAHAAASSLGRAS